MSNICLVPIKDIEEWINNPQLEEGLSLYNKFIANSARYHFYSIGLYSLDELIEELKEVSNKNLEKIKIETVDNTAIKVMQKQALDAWKKRQDLRAKFIYTRSKQTRYVMALEVLQLTDFAISIWKKLDYFREHGVLPTEESKKSKEYTPLIKYINDFKSIDTYISKYQKRIKTEPDRVKTAKYAEMILSYVNKKKEIESYFLECDKILEDAFYNRK